MKPVPTPVTAFTDLAFTPVRRSSVVPTNAFRAVTLYANGYGASILARADDGGALVPFEIAVLRDGRLCYNTPVTSDVIRVSTEAAVNATLAVIAALPTPR